MDMSATSSAPAARYPVILAYPFRPFFLAAGAYAVVLMGVWAATLFLGFALPIAIPATQWHGHEMLFGVVPTAIAGFLLTAMCAWTGARPLRGAGLGALVGLWLAGRIAMAASGILPAALVAAIDLAFLPAVGAYAARVLIAHDNQRNLVLVAMIAALTAANLAMHLDFAGVWPGGAYLGERIALDLITLMMLVIGARITPAFTANWLRMHGHDPSVVYRSERLDVWAAASALLVVPADLVADVWPYAVTVTALAAAAISGWRLWRWHGWSAAAEPLVWVLHLGIAWIVVALAVKGITPLAGLAPSAWIHVLGAGAVATMLLGVMTRVALGHTGRPLRLPPTGVAIYGAVSATGLLRSAAALGTGPVTGLLAAAAVMWIVAFGWFLLLYFPILTSPRADGRPG